MQIQNAIIVDDTIPHFLPDIDPYSCVYTYVHEKHV